MKVEQANAIPMSEILDTLGFIPILHGTLDILYYSPFQKQRMPNFHVNALKNTWHDTWLGRSGRPIDFVCLWLEYSKEDSTVTDALRWLNNMMLKPSPLIYFPNQQADENEAPLVLKHVAPLQHKSLLSYLDERNIPRALGCKHLKEVLVSNRETGKDFLALGMRNEENGYALRNKLFKGSLAPNHISFIRGTRTSCGEINVFEGWTDFLSALVYQNNNCFVGDSIVLNTLSNLSKAIPYIETCPYTQLRTWLDNDAAGEKATKAFRRFADARRLEFKTMNEIYAPHKDVNAWHTHKQNLSLY